MHNKQDWTMRFDRGHFTGIYFCPQCQTPDETAGIEYARLVPREGYTDGQGIQHTFIMAADVVIDPTSCYVCEREYDGSDDWFANVDLASGAIVGVQCAECDR
jgi:hypothetical protein